LNLEIIARLLPEFERPDARDRFSTTIRPPPTDDGYASLPYDEPGPLETAFIAALKEGAWLLGAPFSPVDWIQSPEGQLLTRHPAALAKATSEQLARLLTTLLRQERFSDGTLSDAFDRGILLAVVRRAEMLTRDSA
jgi:hypothetical protein